MSPPHAYTLGLSSFDEDVGDICPICEGECTCNNTSSTPAPPPQPLVRSSSSYPAVSPHSPPPPRPPSLGPLKIKLTVPPNLLAKARMQSSAPASASSSTRPKSDPHRRPRPHKTAAVAVARSTAYADVITHSKTTKTGVIKSKGKDTIGKPSKRRAAPGSDDEYHPAVSGSSTLRRAPVQNTRLDDDGDEVDNDMIDDTRTIRFPTFVSAMSSSSADDSSESSSSSSEEESDLTDFSDSSIEQEEESFIQSDELQRQRSHAHDKARVKRELLGENSMKWKDRRNTWDIRPRKKSVGPSDDDMNVDSDDTEDDGEEGDEEGGIADDDEEDLDGDDDEQTRGMYAGIATGWSEDEDSFDAELFFAGLSDSESGAEQCDEGNGDATVDENDVDEDDNMLDTALLAAHGIFEITESWDGSVVFTNGLQDGQGLLNWDFENSVTQFDDASSDGSGEDTDVQMSDEMGGDQGEDDDLQEVESNDGNTTEEELVDERGLPTDRAMRLFRPPTTPLPSVNPMSTMTVVVRLSPTSGQPKPWSVDEDEEEGSPDSPVNKGTSQRFREASAERDKRKVPIMGTFEAAKGDSLRRAVIDGSRPKDLPSPFPPKARKRRASESISSRSISMNRDRSLSLSQSFTLSPSPLGALLPSLLAAEDPAPESSEPPPSEPIRLDDVLDASMLDSDPFDAPPDTELSSCDMQDEDSGRHLQSLSRWDRVPMNAFRRTRESGLMSDSATEFSYGHLIRSSPFNGTLWTRDEATSGHISSPTATSSKSKKGRKGKGRMDVMISPVLLPVRDRDGDRTPTGFNTYTPPSSSKSRRGTRREKMLKRKSMMGAAPGKRHQQHFHHHGHHPNMKTGRVGGSAQRGFFGGSVPPLSL